VSRRDHHGSTDGLSIQYIVNKLDNGEYDSSVQDAISYLLFQLAQLNALVDQMEDQIKYLTREVYKNA
jgi:hypothetical protein